MQGHGSHRGRGKVSIATVRRVTHRQRKMQFGEGIGNARRRATCRGTNQGCKSWKHPGLSQGEEESKLVQSGEKAWGTATGERTCAGSDRHLVPLTRLGHPSPG